MIDFRRHSNGRLARAATLLGATLLGMCSVLWPGSASAAPHALVRGLVSRGSQPPGTSEGSPQWAGIVADLDQYAGRPLGFLNPALYALGGLGRFDSVGRDITLGNNALLEVPGAVAPGYSATRGWDPASGWGSPNLVELPNHWFELLEH